MAQLNECPSLYKKIHFLKTVQLFKRLKNDDLGKVAFDFRERKYPKKTLIFHQEDSSTELYIVRAGKIRVYKEARFNTETTIVVFGCGDVIGEFSIIDNQLRSTAAKTVDECILLQISRERFLHHLHTIPDLGVGMCELLVSKARWCTVYAETIAQYNGASRFLRLMVLYNNTLGQDTRNGERVLDFGMSQRELASLAGIGRSTLNRKLNKWCKRGILSYYRKKIVIHNMEAVQAELQMSEADQDM